MSKQAASFDTVESVVAQIDELRSLDLRQTEVADIGKLVRTLCTNLNVRSPVTSARGVCRGREIRVDNVHEISYRPSEDVTRFGRLHCPQESVFYCSLDHVTVLAELRDRPGQHRCILNWELKSPELKAVHAHLGFNSDVVNRIMDPEIKKFMSALNSRLTKDMSQEELEIQDMISGFLNEEFEARIGDSEDYRYRITASIGEMYFKQESVSYKNYPFAGILYPSVERGEAINIGLLPNFVDEYYKPTKGILYELTHTDRGVNAKEIEKGVVKEGGKILWSKSEGDMVTRTVRISPVE